MLALELILIELLPPYHEPSIRGHTDQRPFAPHNYRGGERICMPTMVSFLHSNAYRPKPDGSPGEGQVNNCIYERSEEPTIGEKEQLLGYQEGDTAAEGVTEAQRAVRLGRALDGHIMRWFGAFL